MASDAAADAALAARDVATGILWSDRMVARHRPLRVREGPSLLKMRADLLALAGDAPAAVRLYSAARRTTSARACGGRCARSPPSSSPGRATPSTVWRSKTPGRRARA